MRNSSTSLAINRRFTRLKVCCASQFVLRTFESLLCFARLVAFGVCASQFVLRTFEDLLRFRHFPKPVNAL